MKERSKQGQTNKQGKARQCVQYMYMYIYSMCGCTQVDSQESSRRQKKAEILENLQRLYPGVVSV